MTDLHPGEGELIGLALADSGPAREASVRRHLADCPDCRGTVDTLRAQANAMRLAAPRSIERTEDCLDAESIAALADGSLDVTSASAAFAHLLTCPQCCRDVASTARLLEDANVRGELDRLASRGRRRKRLIGGVSLGAAAAAVLLVLFGRAALYKVAKQTFREESLTGATAPRLISPIGTAALSDTFRWTSVPRANQYHITVFNRDGSVVWEAPTRDTAMALPGLLTRAADETYLWRVEARVGWEDRWAASDLATMTVHGAKPR